MPIRSESLMRSSEIWKVMFDRLKKSMLEGAKSAVRSYNEGRFEMDAESRQAFDRLELDYESDITAIKRRYKELSKRYHPDSGISPETERFLSIKNSYDVLRSAYKEKATNKDMND